MNTAKIVAGLRYYSAHAAAFGGLAAAAAFAVSGKYNEALISGLAALSGFGLPIAPTK